MTPSHAGPLGPHNLQIETRSSQALFLTLALDYNTSIRGSASHIFVREPARDGDDYLALLRERVYELGERRDDLALELAHDGACAALVRLGRERVLDDVVARIYNMLAGVSGTAVGDAIAVSTQHLKEGIAKSKIIILVTDGENNSGTVDPIAAAKAAAAYGIKVYTILMTGSISNLPLNIPYRDQLIASYQENTPKMAEAKRTLREISDITGAQAYVATDTAGLNDIYAQINALEKTVYREVKKLNYEDAYQNLLWLALIFALLAFLGGKFIFIKIP